jgi:hypothetical protein
MDLLTQSQHGQEGAQSPPQSYYRPPVSPRFCIASSTSVCETSGFLTLPNLRSICAELRVHRAMAESKSSASVTT